MDIELSLRGITLITLSAFVWFVFYMNPFMIGQITLLLESFPAFGTHEGFM